MLIDFRFSNYRSYRDETVLSMEARGIQDDEEGLTTWGKYKLLPSMAILGKNGSGKSNLVRAFWLAVQFITHAQMTQHEGARVPVRPFRLSDSAAEEPTSFEFTFIEDSIRYVYGFKATTEKITEEYLRYYPKRYPAVIFERKEQNFYFPAGSDRKFKELISKAVAPNQLYFSVACAMNYQPCIKAMNWFRNRVTFTRDYTDLPEMIKENINNDQILNAMKQYAEEADVGIEDMQFELNNTPLGPSVSTEELKKNDPDMPEELSRAIAAFWQSLSASPNASEISLNKQELKVATYHHGLDADGRIKNYMMTLQDESDGTRRIMALAPDFESALQNGGLLIADELEIGIHPLMMQKLIEKVQNPKTNPHHAQLIFTTHDVNVMDFKVLRRDQIAFVDKDRESGASELYQIEDIRDFSGSNAISSYLAGKFGAVPEFDEEDDL